MECPTCGYVMSDLDADCRRCQSLVRAKTSVWPPPIADRPQEATRPILQLREQRDTPGLREGVPPEVMALKWNWGAFCNGWLWCGKHNLPLLSVIFFLAWGLRMAVRQATSPVALWVDGLCSLVTLGLSIYLGLNGHRLAWQNREFPGGFPQFIAVQRAWTIWGLGIGVPFLLLCLLCISYLASVKPSMGAGEAFAPPPTAPRIMPPSTPAPIVLYRREPMADVNGGYPPAEFHQRFGPGGQFVPRMFNPRPPGLYIPRGYPVIPGGAPRNVSPNNSPSAFPYPSASDDGQTATPPGAGQQMPRGIGDALSSPGGEANGAPGASHAPASSEVSPVPPNGYVAPPGEDEQPQARMSGQAPPPNGVTPPHPGGF